MTKTSFK